MQEREAHILHLFDKIEAEKDRHKGELEALREQCRNALDDARREGLTQRVTLLHIDSQIKHLRYTDAF